MKGPLDIHRDLLARDVPHEIVRLPRPVLHAAELPDVLDMPPAQCLVVSMFDAGTELVATITTAGRLPSLSQVRAAVGRPSLAPASALRVNAITDYAASLVAPLLLPSSVTLLADSSVTTADVVYAPTGDCGTALGIAATHLLAVNGAAVGDLSGADPTVWVAFRAASATAVYPDPNRTLQLASDGFAGRQPGSSEHGFSPHESSQQGALPRGRQQPSPRRPTLSVGSGAD